MALGIINPFPRIFYAISGEKSYLNSMPFLTTYIDVRTVKFFPPAKSWLVNSNFRLASCMQGKTRVKNRISTNQIRCTVEKIYFASTYIRAVCKVVHLFSEVHPVNWRTLKECGRWLPSPEGRRNPLYRTQRGLTVCSKMGWNHPLHSTIREKSEKACDAREMGEGENEEVPREMTTSGPVIRERIRLYLLGRA